jgi:hypothetical protein
VRYRFEVRLGPADVGRRVVIRWRRPTAGGDQIADVIGLLEEADGEAFTVRTPAGDSVVIPVERALAAKPVPPAPPRRRPRAPG